jgi:broad specificity phosphatase PhoE
LPNLRSAYALNGGLSLTGVPAPRHCSNVIRGAEGFNVGGLPLKLDFAMSLLEQIVVVRHGETVGQSSIRYYGATDIALSGLGADQVATAARAIGEQRFDLVVASPLQRAWQSARIVVPGEPIQLEPGFREIDFGHWEGLTKEEIEATDPSGYAQWQREGIEFDFPGGETRVGFRARVNAGLDRLLTEPVRSMLIVAHKGIVRTVAERLCDAKLSVGQPELGGYVELTRDPSNYEAPWRIARSSF